MQLFKEYNINFSAFNLNESQFDNHSGLHGVMHTYRVMVHVLRLGLLSGKISETRIAFFAAYIHDMARKHDGYCTRHGADAANYKLPVYRKLFLSQGVTNKELIIIGKAVTLHSTGNELPGDDPDWYTVAILKDADALDRIRLGNDNLDPSYLRLQETHQCVEFAEYLFDQTQNRDIRLFGDVLNIILPEG